MKTTVTEHDFIQAFTDARREKQFSFNGLKALYRFIEEHDECSEDETELDVIALCCDFCEYKNLEEFQENYNKDDYPSIAEIETNTILIMVDDDSFIIQQF